MVNAADFRVQGQNITLVYGSLDVEAFDSSKLKTLLGDKAQPMIMDTPNVIVVVFAEQQLVIQIGDRRVRITLQGAAKEIGRVPIWDVAEKCHELVRGSALTAYGFNYDITADLGIGSTQVLIKHFLRGREEVEKELKGDLLAFIPRLKFERGKTVYDLILEPGECGQIKAHLNTHFQATDLPPQPQLEESFRQDFMYLVSTLPGLLEEGE